ncbi:MAG TPA: CopG family transcriptional regulator [Mycobacteriales bacterium]|nr:CopG family transcriptional regulator [Mycobacteriales bacterium]
MSPKYVLGPDIDLDVEIVTDEEGRRITERRAQAIAADTLRRAGVGRPSLTGQGARSPEVKARVPAELRDRLAAAARERGTTPSTLIREALERYLAS